MENDVKQAIQAVADDWRETHTAGGDCTHFAIEFMQIMLPMINRAQVSHDEATTLLIHAGNYADGSDPDTFVRMLAELDPD